MDKRYLLRVTGYIALALAAVILIVDIAFQIGGAIVESVETLPVTAVHENQLLTADGYIVRTEVPLTTASDGLLSQVVTDGTKVSAGDRVAEIYQGGADQRERLEKLRNAQHQLNLLEEALSKRGTFSQSSTDREITRLKGEIDALTASGKTIGLDELTDSLQVMLYIRELKTGGNLDSIKASIEESISSLKEQVGGSLSSVQTDRSGYYFSSCDGYENCMTVEELENAAPDELRELISKQCEPMDTALTAGKVVTDYTWCIVMEVPFTAAQGLNQGKTYSILLSELGDTKISMKLDRLIIEYGSDTALLVFSCTEMPAGFTYTRYQSASVVLSETDGYRLPVGALRKLDGITGVYVLRGSVVEFREIAPIVIADGVVLADASAEPTGKYSMLNLYDTLIVRGKELYVGRIIDQ